MCENPGSKANLGVRLTPGNYVVRAVDVENQLLREERDAYRTRAEMFANVLRKVSGVLRDMTVGAPTSRAEIAADGVDQCLEENSFEIDRDIARVIGSLPLSAFERK